MLNKDCVAALRAHLEAIRDDRIGDYLKNDTDRFENLSQSVNGVLFDYSKHHVTAETITLLMDLAGKCDLENKRDTMFSGAPVNASQGRAALHPALRGSVDADLEIDGENVSEFVDATKAQMRTISEEIRNNPKITDIINIGIGGSDLGPRIGCEALAHYRDGPHVHFVANIDGQRLADLFDRLNPAQCVFVISSKTFTTQETLMNAYAARDWFLAHCDEDQVAAHFYAVSANTAGAEDFGIAAHNVVPMRDWVGGRFSVWGGIGLPLAASIGFDRFEEFLGGARMMDTHFRDAPLVENIPVIMAMLGVWYHNFWDYPAHCVVPYAQTMTSFSRYVMQIDMESNGKAAALGGGFVDYKTAPITFGEPGTNAQHAFFQLLHQGTQIVPVDFIAAVETEHNYPAHHQKLLSNALAQSQAMMMGDAQEIEAQHFEGNRPSSTILLDRLDPKHLGMLMAMYEHKVFVQGVIWGINSFDQMGVELGKRLADTIEDAFDSDRVLEGADASTRNLMRHILQKRV
ncbi:MAG: glucose-6-phosphate isomerase [Alphaproteobacteria bacterium]